MLEQRKLHLTAICEVREFLTPENHRELLAEVSGQSKLRVREILARHFPESDVRTSLRKLPELDPLSPGRYRLLLTLNAQQKAKLELARDLSSHSNPNGDFAIVVERALDELIMRLEKRRLGRREARASIGATKRRESEAADTTPADTTPADTEPAKATPAQAEPNRLQPSRLKACTLKPIDRNEAEGGSRRRKHIPNAVRRELVARDGACCSFVGLDGRRCQERGYLQFHHRNPWARGGSDTPENLALLCQAHNRLLAEQDFGKARVQSAIDQRESARSHPCNPSIGQPRRAR
jgi:hypothetical protein